jgi:hypothetical protein
MAEPRVASASLFESLERILEPATFRARWS